MILEPEEEVQKSLENRRKVCVRKGIPSSRPFTIFAREPDQFFQSVYLTSLHLAVI